MIANADYVHLQNGGMLHFVGPTGKDCYAVLDCREQWPKCLALSHTPDVNMFAAKHVTWIDELSMLDWLPRNTY